jgi:hypothetical protein
MCSDASNEEMKWKANNTVTQLIFLPYRFIILHKHIDIVNAMKAHEGRGRAPLILEFDIGLRGNLHFPAALPRTKSTNN